MDIANFDKLRVGSKFPFVFDVYKIGVHETDGICAFTCNFRSNNIIVLREKKYGHIGVFTYTDKYIKDEIFKHEMWKDSEVIYDSVKNNKENISAN